MYYFDSYAIIEIARGNPKYRQFSRAEGVTSVLNLLEVFYILAQAGEPSLARSTFESGQASAVQFPASLVPVAATFRLGVCGATGRRFSYIDALGYTYSRESGYDFLTGAEEFEGFEGVRFVR